MKMKEITSEFVYGYDPSNNMPGEFIDDDDDCYIEDFSSYDAYFSMTRTEKYAPVGFQSGTWDSPIMPFRQQPWTEDEETSASDWGHFHSFPLTPEDAQAFEAAVDLGLSKIPVSFGCSNLKQFELTDLQRCPCFLLSTMPEVGSYAYSQLSNYHDISGSSHDCTSCNWCTLCPSFHPDHFCLVSGFEFTGPVSAPHLPWVTQLPDKLPVRIEASSWNLLPPEEGVFPPPPRKAQVTVKFAKHAPDKPICQLSPRLLDVKCHRHCQSPYDAFKRRNSHSCFEDPALKGWSSDPPTTKDSFSSSANPATIISTINLVLLSAVLVMLLANTQASQVTVICSGAQTSQPP